MDSTFDSVVLIAFGGPEKPDDIRPFLANVTRGRPIPPERLELVVQHYEEIGGRSPLNEHTFRQAIALAEELRAHGPPLPVYVGMRNWHPYLSATLAEMARRGHRRAIGLILSPQQSEAGWGRYMQNVAEARGAIEHAPEVIFAPPWAEHPLFIAVVAERVSGAFAQLSAEARTQAHLVFTAHSIPVAMASDSPYVQQFERGARAVAAQLRHANWSLAYQSRSGNPRDTWLEPDINDALQMLAAQGKRIVVVVPIGFVSDHVEVLYDLDIQARATAERLGLRFLRAQTVNDHPRFIELLAELVRATVADAASRLQAGMPLGR
jgi:ferrochelatase